MVDRRLIGSEGTAPLSSESKRVVRVIGNIKSFSKMQREKHGVQLKLDELLTVANKDTAAVPLRLSAMISCSMHSNTLRLDELLPPANDGDVYVQLNLSELIQRPTYPLLLCEMLSTAGISEAVATPEFSLERELFGASLA